MANVLTRSLLLCSVLDTMRTCFRNGIALKPVKPVKPAADKHARAKGQAR
jgi:hypothetical protein